MKRSTNLLKVPFLRHSSIFRTAADAIPTRQEDVKILASEFGEGKSEGDDRGKNGEMTVRTRRT
ncbi:hypothetical protein [Nonomuraea pusilla]|uniref:hypothetical protein n=1 Tax=Nonomuraea pusilla TaxID=46177 RepID=UPI000AAA2979|nr:hypothetical protein [Nonomuraea pusilla]